MLVVRDLVQKTLKDVAPEEIILIDHFVEGTNSGQASKGALGFGQETVIVLVLPIVWKIVDAIVLELTNEIAKATVGSLKKVMSKILSIDTREDSDEMIISRLTDWLHKEGIEKDKARIVALKIITELLSNDKVIK